MFQKSVVRVLGSVVFFSALFLVLTLSMLVDGNIARAPKGVSNVATVASAALPYTTEPVLDPEPLLVEEKPPIITMPDETPVDLPEADSDDTHQTAAPEEVVEPPVVVPEEPPAPAIVSHTKNSVPPKFDEVAMLKAHNLVRARQRLEPLTWSDELAADAQAWSKVLQAEGCTYRHASNLEHGENTFWSWISISDGVGLISTPSDAVNWWAAEKKFYNYDKNTCKDGKDCGHYTQVVWDTTTEVGCGVSTCLYDGGQADVWVCRYNPPGNLIGQKPY